MVFRLCKKTKKIKTRMLKVMDKCLKKKSPMKMYKFYLLLVLQFFSCFTYNSMCTRWLLGAKWLFLPTLTQQVHGKRQQPTTKNQQSPLTVSNAAFPGAKLHICQRKMTSFAYVYDIDGLAKPVTPDISHSRFYSCFGQQEISVPISVSDRQRLGSQYTHTFWRYGVE